MQTRVSRTSIFVVTLVVLVVIIVVFLFFRVSTKDTSQIAIVTWTPETSLVRTDYPHFEDQGELSTLLQALQHSSDYYNKQNPSRNYQYGADVYSASKLADGLYNFKTLLERHGLTAELYQQIQSHFVVYRSAHNNPLFTGYYEPELYGAWQSDQKFRYPIYRKPDDLYTIKLSDFMSLQPHLTAGVPKELRGRIVGQEIKPYLDRDQIDYQSKLTGRGLELLWVDDLVDLFFLQIQGSGRIRMNDGSVIRVGYADKNGQPYRAIGRLLLDRGKLSKSDMSMQSIKNYLRANPSEMREILSYNPSYVFFRQLEEAALGSLGRPVTAMRTIATDSSLLPHGSLAYIELPVPEFDEKGAKIGEKNISHFVFNQDTGGAIKTPGRVDLFTGTGQQAELLAGHLASRGQLYFLAPVQNQ